MSLRGLPGDDDNRDARLPNDAELKEIEAAHARQPDVEQHQVWTVALEDAERRLGRRHELRCMTQLAEKVLEHPAELGIVFDDEEVHVKRPAG